MDILVEIDSDEVSLLTGNYHLNYTCRKVDSEVLQERYVFSGYIIDPNRFILRKVVRVLALVMLFIRKFIKRVRRRESEFINNSLKQYLKLNVNQDR